MRFYATYLAQRLGQFLLVVFIGINLTYLITHLTPIDPVRLKQLAAGGGAKLAASVPKRRVELWHTLGAALLILLLGEALLLRRK